MTDKPLNKGYDPRKGPLVGGCAMTAPQHSDCKRIDIRVNYTLHVKEEDMPYLLKLAKEQGLDYGDDPGPKEIARRLLIAQGTDNLEKLNEDPEGIRYTIHEPLLKGTT